MQSGVYRDIKGDLYQVLGVGQHDRTGELLVVYVPLTTTPAGTRLRFRALEGQDGWNVPVHLTEQSAQQRFTYVGDSAPPPEATWG